MSMPDDDAQPATSRSAADKERSRQQSRPVTGKGTTSTQGGGSTGAKGGNAQRSSGNGPSGSSQGSGNRNATTKNTTTKQGGQRSTAGQRPQGSNQQRPKKSGNRPVTTGRSQARRAPARRSTTTLLTWGAVALVLVIVVVLVVVKVTGNNNTTSGQTTFQPVPASIMNSVENVPLSVFNKVGVGSTQFPVSPPTEIKGQPPLTFPASNATTTGQGEGAGTTSSTGLPGVFYLGAEYCPYCAAERWPFVIALSRFGKINNLGLMQSSANDVFPNTHTFTFSKADFTSPYISLKAVEHYSDTLVNGNYGVLQPVTQEEVNLINKYDNSKYYSNSTTSTSGSIPFIDFANKWFVSGASYSPSVLTGLTQDQIASQLNDPTSPVTQAIISAANYLTAAICQGTGGQPASVCATKGVQAAEKSMGIKS